MQNVKKNLQLTHEILLKVILDALYLVLHVEDCTTKLKLFPLTTDDNIHSRLTHSMEVMNIGLSFAINLCENKSFQDKTDLSNYEIIRKISPILKTSCLVHDIGNPPFGHFGEEVIQDYFTQLLSGLDFEMAVDKKLGDSHPLSRYIISGLREVDVETDDKKIAITFDDGPHPKQTKKILNMLDKHCVKATFFAVVSKIKVFSQYGM